MNISQPIASYIGGISFGLLTKEDIKQLSVKQITHAVTFDDLLHPEPAGLYDPALGATADEICRTCNLKAWSCPGHPGHIELPVMVYNPFFLDQMLHLLNAKCSYCHRLRIVASKIEMAKCKLKLLDKGLIEEAEDLENITLRSERIKADEEAESSAHDAEDDAQELTGKQREFVKLSLRKARGDRNQWVGDSSKSEAVSARRRAVIGELLADSRSGRLCPLCKGANPRFRKDGYSKIFSKPLSALDRRRMHYKGMKIQNPLVSAAKQRKKDAELARQDREIDEAIGFDSDEIIPSSEEGEDIRLSEDESDNASPLANGKRKKSDPSEFSEKYDDRYVSPQEAYAALRLLFEQEPELFQLIYNRGAATTKKPMSPTMFYIEYLLVPPNRFRPEMKNSDGSTVEAADNSLYKAVLNACKDFVKTKARANDSESQPAERGAAYTDLQRRHIALQEAVNAISDSSHGPRQSNPLRQKDGIKQKLEKKEGLFRMNMMGKRVNFAARSVISPDPNIETNEIGVPPVFAKKLTFAEPVTNHNYAELKEAVLNGVSKWPGAAAIENESGQVINLRFKTSDERLALANLLLQPSNPNVNGSRSKKVHRHLINGDVVLMNRQPTLHKPSIMAHKARILPGERTIRMHYANCNTYNADFDGDEMNMHFPQNELARAEALQIADTDHQYLVATSGKPLRGLIQDHISVSVWLTSRNTFFTRDDYHQLLCSCLRPEKDQTHSHKIETVEPSIVRPRKLWTGKQVITTILKNIQPSAHEPLQMQGKSQTQGDYWGDPLEGEVVVKDGELLCGILDKAQVGPSTGGLVHAIYEVYGHTVAGQLLSILGRLLTRFLHMRAFTCGIDDLRLTPEGEEKRRARIATSIDLGQRIAAKYVTLSEETPENDQEMQNRLQDVFRDEAKHTGIDHVYLTRNAVLSSEITAQCLPKHLVKPFPNNQMQTMTVSGAKGSSVNANLISCNLGQQVLEGRRVPVMVSGRTLPSFKPFDTSVRSGGYITNRFLTGIRPQEYFFHAMAGREGLIDTAVKTARSGYLQRCIIKGMEGLRSEYDASVRDSDGSMIQFMYGEDGLDVTKQKHLMDFHFQLENYLSLTENLNIREMHSRIKDSGALEHNKAALKKYTKTGRLDCMDPALALYNPSSSPGSTSEAFALALKTYSERNPDGLLVEKRDSKGTKSQFVKPLMKKSTFAALMNSKYLRSTMEPGEAVGVVAGQSIGEPSTQMTLNTFHLAGHAAKNVTLGIPRLREIVMTATREISTPSMTLHLIDELTKEAGEKFAKGITKLTLAEVIDNVQISERVGKGTSYALAKIYCVRLNLFPAPEYCETYAITISDVLRTLETEFVPLLGRDVKKELKRKADAKKLGDYGAQPRIGKSYGKTDELSGDQDAEKEGGEDDEMDDDGDATNAKEKKNRGEATTYEDPDDDEAEAAGKEDDSDSSTDADSGIDSALGASPKSPSSKKEDPDEEKEEAERKRKKKESKAIKAEAKEREGRVKEKADAVTRFTFDVRKADVCEVQLEYDINTPKLLLLPLVESACRQVVIQAIPKLGACTYTHEKVKDTATGQLKEVPVVLTQGVNLPAMHAYQDIINPHQLFTNDIWAVLEIYGVEAGRATIVREMDAVFKGHSISVDPRHLNLIADYMTRSGSIQPFSRNGIVNSVSPLQKASFETTIKFVRDAVLDRDRDDLSNPSARIVVGKLSGVGTGSFDVLNPVDADTPAIQV